MNSPRIRIIKPHERRQESQPKETEESFDESSEQQREAATKIGQWVKEWRKQKLQDVESK